MPLTLDRIQILPGTAGRADRYRPSPFTKRTCMSTIWPVEQENGAGWAVASDLFTGDVGAAPAHVLVPIDCIPELTTTELGHAVRSLCAIAQRCHAEEIARQILHLSRTPAQWVEASAALADARPWLQAAAPVSPLARAALRIIVELLPQNAACSTGRDVIAQLLEAHAAADALFVSIGQREGFFCADCTVPTDLHVVLPSSSHKHEDADHDRPRLLCARCVTRHTRTEHQ